MGTYATPADAPMTLEGLMTYCGLPASCGTSVDWEGRIVAVEGFVDAANVFDKRRYPNLPYEKFRLIDGQGRSVEVWARAADNRPIFDKLAKRSKNKVVIRGRLALGKAPVMGACKLKVKVLIDDPNQIEL
jgi:hypothetical protein